MPNNEITTSNWYHADVEEGHYHDISWESLQESEYDMEDRDIRYPEEYYGF